MSEADDAVVLKIRGAIGKHVHFLYPGTEGRKDGTLKDRVVVSSVSNTPGVPYWDVVDLIEFKNEPEREWIRIGYYRKPAHRLILGSQTTITEPIGIWKKILVQAAREKWWFKNLLREVMREVEKE